MTGFACISVTESCIELIFMIVPASIISLFLSTGLYLGAFHKHYESMWRTMNKLIDEKIPEVSRVNRIKARLIETIKFHRQTEQ